MREEKNRAITLRKEGRSYSQIQETLHVAKSTLSYWLRDITLSNEAQQKIAKRASVTSTRTLIERNKEQTAIALKRAFLIRGEAKEEVIGYMSDPLFIAGVSLYWAEGYKRGASGSKWKCVDFTNADPEMVEMMMDFFRKFCSVEESRFKVQLIAHSNVDMQASVGYWSALTGIPESQFIKTCTSLSVRSGQKRANSLTYGTVHIRVYDVKLFFRIIGWIDGLKAQLLKNKTVCAGL